MMSDRWFYVYEDNGKVVLSVFPYEPGGATVYLSTDVAIRLAHRLLVVAGEPVPGTLSQKG